MLIFYRYRARNKRLGKGQFLPATTSALTPKEKLELENVTKTTTEKLMAAELSKANTTAIDAICMDKKLVSLIEISWEIQNSEYTDFENFTLMFMIRSAYDKVNDIGSADVEVSSHLVSMDIMNPLPPSHGPLT